MVRGIPKGEVLSRDFMKECAGQVRMREGQGQRERESPSRFYVCIYKNMALDRFAAYILAKKFKISPVL